MLFLRVILKLKIILRKQTFYNNVIYFWIFTTSIFQETVFFIEHFTVL